MERLPADRSVWEAVPGLSLSLTLLSGSQGAGQLEGRAGTDVSIGGGCEIRGRVGTSLTAGMIQRTGGLALEMHKEREHPHAGDRCRSPYVSATPTVPRLSLGLGRQCLSTKNLRTKMPPICGVPLLS